MERNIRGEPVIPDRRSAPNPPQTPSADPLQNKRIRITKRYFAAFHTSEAVETTMRSIVNKHPREWGPDELAKLEKWLNDYEKDTQQSGLVEPHEDC
jgi:hypothetical protein